MRAVILSLALAAMALPAAAQAPAAPSKEALSLGDKAAHGAQPHLEEALHNLVQGLAVNYRTQAQAHGEAVDEKALEAVTKAEADSIKPAFWNSLARIYADTYSVDELKALNAFYKDNPGSPPTSLPVSLGAKNDDIVRGQQALVNQLGPRILQDFFGDYCSRATCSDDIRRGAGLPVKAKAN